MPGRSGAAAAAVVERVHGGRDRAQEREWLGAPSRCTAASFAGTQSERSCSRPSGCSNAQLAPRRTQLPGLRVVVCLLSPVWSRTVP